MLLFMHFAQLCGNKGNRRNTFVQEKNRNKILVIMKLRNTFLLLAALIIVFTGCRNSKGDEPLAKTIKYVKVETIDGGAVQNSISFNGKIKEKSLTSLSFRVGGPIKKLEVKEGDYVREGQLIAQIDKRDYELQVATTKAQFEQVEGEYNRYKQLIDQKKIPENTFEKIKSGYLMAKTAYENAQNQLRDTELKAPFSGYVYQKFTESYQTVGPGAPVVSLIDNSHLEAVVSVSESQLQRINKDKEAFLTVANAGVDNLPVRLLSVGEKAGNDGLYEVRFSFQNTSDLNVVPGMTAEIKMLCNAEDGQMAITSTAVFHEKTNTYVWIFNPSNNKVEKREVSVALGGPKGMLNVVSGLSNGEQIVTAGVHYLVDGQSVKPIQKSSETNVGGLL